MKRPARDKTHFVHKHNAFKAACGQDIPRSRSVIRAKVTCGQCKRTKAFRKVKP